MNTQSCRSIAKALKVFACIILIVGIIGGLILLFNGLNMMHSTLDYSGSLLSSAQQSIGQTVVIGSIGLIFGSVVVFVSMLAAGKTLTGVAELLDRSVQIPDTGNEQLDDAMTAKEKKPKTRHCIHCGRKLDPDDDNACKECKNKFANWLQ